VQIPPTGPSNAAGLWGFILSLLGLVACGAPSPVGLIVSAIGLRKDPRLLAVVGVVLGLLGTIGWGVTWFYIARGASAVSTMVGETLTAGLEFNSDATEIRAACEKYKAQRSVMPGSLDVIDVSEDAKLDPWGNRYRFELGTGDSFTLISDGPDRKTGTEDDMRINSRDLQPQ
jgi:hypothetical protein